MKTNKRFFFATVILLVAYVLSACGRVSQVTDQQSGEQAAIKVRAIEVAFTGVVEAMIGNDWTVNGQVVTVDPAVVRDGPFQVGDTIKIEGNVNPDGSITVSRVEAPTASDLTELPQLGNDNTNVNSNDDNSNATNTNFNSNDDNSNDNNSNLNSNDDNANVNSNDDNSNLNSNDDDDDDDNSNVNINSNSNDDDDDEDDDHSSNNNSNGKNGGSSDDEDDHDGGSNSNGDDD